MPNLHSLVSTTGKRKRIGRGGSRGGTSGKGHKGQKSRSGVKLKASFEGGQMPLSRRLPKRGFNNARFAKNFEIISIELLNRTFDDGAEVNREALLERGLVKGKSGFLLKVLGGSELSKKLIVSAHAFSASAASAIQASGGEVKVL